MCCENGGKFNRNSDEDRGDFPWAFWSQARVCCENGGKFNTNSDEVEAIISGAFCENGGKCNRNSDEDRRDFPQGPIQVDSHIRHSGYDELRS